MDLAQGTRVGRFTIKAKLGQGGMGAVYLADDPEHGRQVALKLLLDADGAGVKRFEREARASATVHAPNVVETYETFVDGGRLVLVVELLTGGTLRQLVKERGPLPWAEAAALGAGIARGLAAIHAAGLVHRDLKPENVLLDVSGEPKITDFGIVRVAAGPGLSQGLTKQGELLGTAAYMAPEQTDGSKVDFRADLYSLGATLYYLLVGQAPFEGEGFVVVARLITETPTPPRELRPEIAPALDQLVVRLLAKEPAERGESALAVALALEALGKKAPSGRRYALAGVVVAVVLVLAVGFRVGASLLSSPPSAPPTPPAPKASPVPAVPPERDAGRSPPPYWQPTEEQKAYAKKTNQPLWFENTLGMKFVLVPPGTFRMGSPDDEAGREANEGPQHEVTLTKGFYLGSTHVTNRQFRRFKPGHRSGEYQRETLDGETQPVVTVSWPDARDFCAWLSKEVEGSTARLPTEAEFEYACRAGTTTSRYWGEDLNQANQYANGNDPLTQKRFHVEDYDAFPRSDGFFVTAPVGSFKPNAFGLFDMLGNAWNWCSDGARPYSAAATTDPEGTSGLRVARGGSWLSDPQSCRAARRAEIGPGTADVFHGFRVVVARP